MPRPIVQTESGGDVEPHRIRRLFNLLEDRTFGSRLIEMSPMSIEDWKQLFHGDIFHFDGRYSLSVQF